jgi:hypothetical protein
VPRCLSWNRGAENRLNKAVQMNSHRVTMPREVPPCYRLPLIELPKFFGEPYSGFNPDQMSTRTTPPSVKCAGRSSFRSLPWRIRIQRSSRRTAEILWHSSPFLDGSVRIPLGFGLETIPTSPFLPPSRPIVPDPIRPDSTRPISFLHS